MAAIDTIANESRCYCLTGVSFERAVIYLLNQIAGGGMTISQIEQNSACYCLTGIAFERAVIYLLSQILAGGGGGGSGNPVDNQALGGNPPAASSKSLVYDTDSGFLWYNDPINGWTNV